jgi:catechol 2,3-dioxygenase-like lactoylglutathione lyase family enzyme
MLGHRDRLHVAMEGVKSETELAVSVGSVDRLSLRWNAVCLDCADAEEMATFYGRLFGWEMTGRDGEGWIAMNDPSGGVGLLFQAEEWYEPPAWPEQSDLQHKMLHFEIEVDDVETAVAHAISAGARVALHQPEDRDPATLRVMLDPAGHPFCLWSNAED